MESVSEFLAWIISGGGSVVIVSYLLERWSWFQSLSSDQRRVVSILFSALLAIGAYFGVQYIPPDVLEELDPIFRIIVGIVGAYGVGQVAHLIDPARKPKG